MRSPAWNSVRHEFAFDGSWRDIYVLDADMDGWQRMLDGLRAAVTTCSYFRDGKPMELACQGRGAFPLEGECDRLLIRAVLWGAG